MSKVMERAALDVANNPDGKRDKAQPAQVVEDEVAWERHVTSLENALEFPLEEALNNANKGDE